MNEENGMIEVNIEYDPKISPKIIALKQELAEKDKKFEELNNFLNDYQANSTVLLTKN